MWMSFFPILIRLSISIDFSMSQVQQRGIKVPRRILKVVHNREPSVPYEMHVAK